jgi:hypothetical protein
MTTILLLLLALTIELDTVIIPLSGDVKITFAPTGRGELKREGTVTRVKVDLEQVRPPAAPFNTYVVWAVSQEGNFENLGELQVERTKGTFEGTTRLAQLGVLISAEPHYLVDRPSAIAAYRSQNLSGQTRRVTIPIEVGTYDYAALKPSSPGVHPAVVQARTALQIAQIAGAERVAEPQFRQARVALGAMEELITRAAPLDILLPSANDAIGWAQKAVTEARERASLMELQNAKAEVIRITAEKQQLDARIQQLQKEQASAAEQIRNLRETVGTAGSGKDAAEARAQQAERELEEWRTRQQELQGRLTMELQNSFYDDAGLTEAGRDALLRLHNIAEVIPGAIRLEGNAPDAAIRAATEYLILAGTAQDRIITRR